MAFARGEIVGLEPLARRGARMQFHHVLRQPMHQTRSRTVRPMLAGLGLLASLAACATSGTSRPRYEELDPAEIQALLDTIRVRQIEQRLATEQRTSGPRVRIWINDGMASINEVRPTFRLDDDAYVAVFNVGWDGRVRLVYPTTVEEAGRMRAGVTYRLPPFHAGFGFPSYGFSRTSFAGYGSRYGSNTRRAGYVFAVASWTPLNFELVDNEIGLDTYRFASNEFDLEPRTLSHRYAQLLVGRDRDDWFDVEYAFYGIGNGLDSRFASRSCLGYIPLYLMQFLPHRGYGFGYWRGSSCDDQLDYATYAYMRHLRQQQVVVQPRRPDPPIDSGRVDSTRSDSTPRMPKPRNELPTPVGPGPVGPASEGGEGVRRAWATLRLPPVIERGSDHNAIDLDDRLRRGSASDDARYGGGRARGSRRVDDDGGSSRPVGSPRRHSEDNGGSGRSSAPPPRSDSPRAEPVRSEPVRYEPGRSDPPRSEPSRSEPSPSGSPRSERTVPGQDP